MLHTIPTLPRILMYEEVVSTAWSDCPWRRKIRGVLPPPLEVRQLLHELVNNWVSPPSPRRNSSISVRIKCKNTSKIVIHIQDVELVETCVELAWVVGRIVLHTHANRASACVGRAIHCSCNKHPTRANHQPTMQINFEALAAARKYAKSEQS